LIVSAKSSRRRKEEVKSNEKKKTIFHPPREEGEKKDNFWLSHEQLQLTPRKEERGGRHLWRRKGVSAVIKEEEGPRSVS